MTSEIHTEVRKSLIQETRSNKNNTCTRLVRVSVVVGGMRSVPMVKLSTNRSGAANEAVHSAKTLRRWIFWSSVRLGLRLGI